MINTIPHGSMMGLRAFEPTEPTFLRHQKTKHFSLSKFLTLLPRSIPPCFPQMSVPPHPWPGGSRFLKVKKDGGRVSAPSRSPGRARARCVVVVVGRCGSDVTSLSIEQFKLGWSMLSYPFFFLSSIRGSYFVVWWSVHIHTFLKIPCTSPRRWASWFFQQIGPEGS